MKQQTAKRKPYTIKAAAQYLGVSVKTIRRRIEGGAIRVSAINPRKHLIPAEDVEDLVDTTC